MSDSKRHLLNLTFVLLAFFAWGQCASLWHDVDHAFHQHTEFCDSLLAAHAQPLASLAAINLFLPTVFFKDSPTSEIPHLFRLATHWRLIARAPPALI